MQCQRFGHAPVGPSSFSCCCKFAASHVITVQHRVFPYALEVLVSPLPVLSTDGGGFDHSLLCRTMLGVRVAQHHDDRVEWPQDNRHALPQLNSRKASIAAHQSAARAGAWRASPHHLHKSGCNVGGLRSQVPTFRGTRLRPPSCKEQSFLEHKMKDEPHALILGQASTSPLMC